MLLRWAIWPLDLLFYLHAILVLITTHLFICPVFFIIDILFFFTFKIWWTQMTKISLWSATIYLLDVTTIRIIWKIHVMSIQIIINTAREKKPWKLSRPETYLKLYRWCLKNEGINSTEWPISRQISYNGIYIYIYILKILKWPLYSFWRL